VLDLELPASPQNALLKVVGCTMKAALLLSLAAIAVATELTKDDWDDKTAGKTVFVKFQAPW